MKTVLYVISTAEGAALIPATNRSGGTQIVLIEGAVQLRDIPHSSVYALAEDVSACGATPAYPTITTQELLRKMFEADTVVAL